MRSSFHCFRSAPSGIATPGCSRSLPTNPSSDIDMYRMTSRMTCLSVVGEDAVREVLGVRRHLGFEQLEAHGRVAREQGGAAAEDEGRDVDGQPVDEAGLQEFVTG